jgi:hypothetical protein
MVLAAMQGRHCNAIAAVCAPCVLCTADAGPDVVAQMVLHSLLRGQKPQQAPLELTAWQQQHLRAIHPGSSNKVQQCLTLLAACWQQALANVLTETDSIPSSKGCSSGPPCLRLGASKGGRPASLAA